MTMPRAQSGRRLALMLLRSMSKSFAASASVVGPRFAYSSSKRNVCVDARASASTAPAYEHCPAIGDGLSAYGRSRVVQGISQPCGHGDRGSSAGGIARAECQYDAYPDFVI